MACGVLVLLANVLLSASGSLPTGGEAMLQYLEGQAVPAVATVGLFLAYDMLLIPVFLALYLALKGANAYAMLVAVAFVGLYIALDLVVTESNYLTLVALSQSYSASTPGVARAAYVAAADYATATIATNSPVYSFVVPAIGILITSLVLLKQKFSRAAGYLGVAGAIIGISYGITTIIPSLSILYILSNFLFAVWYLIVGRSLYRARHAH